MTLSWSLLALIAAWTFVSSLAAGLAVAVLLERNLRSVLSQHAEQHYRRIAASRDTVRTAVDQAATRVETAAAAEHDRTRRILEHRTAYTDSAGFALPTAAQMAGEEPHVVPPPPWPAPTPTR